MKKWQIVMTDTAKSDMMEIAFGIYEVSKDLDIMVDHV